MDYDNETGIFSLIFYPFMAILSYFAMKETVRREAVAECRDQEIERLQRQIEEFQRSRR